MKILKDVFDRELIEDIKNLRYDEVFEKYSEVYPAFYQNDFGEWEAVCGGYRQWVDDNFMRLDFKPIWGDIVGVLRTRMALRVVMKPTIDVNGLLFNAYVDFNNLVKKKEGGFPISQLKEAVLEVRQLSMSDIKFKYHNEIEKAKSERPKSGYICKDVHSSVVRKFDIDNAIRFYYNPNIDLKDNLDNLNRNGVDITKTRLLQYLDEFGEGKKNENDTTRKMPVTYPDKLKIINVDATVALSQLKILTKRIEMTSKEGYADGTTLTIKILSNKLNEIKDLCVEKEPPACLRMT